MTGEQQQRRHETDVAAVVGLMLLTTAAFWRTLPSYFLSDDFVLLKHARTFHDAYWQLFTTGGGDGFFRPVGYLSLAFTSTWAGSGSTLWHAEALALHLVNVALVYKAAVSLRCSKLAAAFAAALFAIHGTRPEVAVWIAGRFDLLSTFFVLCGLLFFICAQSEVALVGYVHATASLVCMVLAILSKETGYVSPALLILILVVERRVSRRTMASLVPFFVVAAALFTYRWTLVGGIGGYKNAATEKPLALTIGLLPALKALFWRIWAVLFFPINWSHEPNKLVAVLMVGYILALVWLSTARVNRMRIVFPLAFVLLTSIPALPLLLIGPDLNKARLLYLPSTGFCLALAVLVDGLRSRVRWIVPAVILVFHAAALEHNLNIWNYAAAKAKSASATGAACVGPGVHRIVVAGLPGTLRGVPFFANGFQEAVDLQRGDGVVPVDMSGSVSGDDAGAACMLAWDSTKDELRVVR